MKGPVVRVVLAAVTALTAATQASSNPAPCSPSSFSALLSSPTLIPGAEVVDIEARELRNYKSVATFPPRYSDLTVEDACEVRLAYINPATNSTRVTVTVWLPTQARWNGRYVGTGGGGWQCSMGVQALHLGIANNAATATTDGGLRGLPFETDYTLLSPGNPDVYLLERLGHRAIHDMTVAAKAVIQTYYGRASRKHYYLGCSTGGRQGMVEATRYPHDYDGLLLGAPAYEFGSFVVGLLQHTAVMNRYNTYPSSCELNAIREASIEACDALDGRVDGIVARQDLCKFAASNAVGRTYVDKCGDNETRTVTADAARIYQASHSGSFDYQGKPIGPGYPWGVDMVNERVGALRVTRDPKTGRQHGVPFPFSRQYVEHYLEYGLRDVDWSQVTLDDVSKWQEESVARYDAVLEPSNDLHAFQQRGGKIMLYHGQEDEIIPVGVSYSKYDKIRAVTAVQHRNIQDGFASLNDFLRFFVVPGMAHCGPLLDRVGQSPSIGSKALQQLFAWVEEGIAPERLHVQGVSKPGLSEVCLWPQQPRWTDNGQTLLCEQANVVKDALTRLLGILDLPVQFFEVLPHWLLLRTKRLLSEL